MKIVSLSLQQGVGARPTPIVAKGDAVKRGQVIAEAIPDKLCVPLHTSVTGVVREITDDFIVIEQTEETQDFEKLNLEGSVAEIVRAAGLIGLGGAGFPTYVKLGTQLQKGGYLICNAAECEPVLGHNLFQMEQDIEGLIDGMHISMESTGAEKGIIGMKLKHKGVIKKITSFLKEKGITDIRVLPLRNIYPVGEERALIRDTINQLLPPGALPVEANSIVMNAETLYAVRDAVRFGKPLIDKWVTVAGRLRDIPKNEVFIKEYPLGTSIQEIIDEFGGVVEPVGEILLGGPYTGRRALLSQSLSKTTGGVIVTDEFDRQEKKLGIIQCACGPLEPRLREIAASMGSEVVAKTICKNAHEKNGTYKCQDPGNCPGQAEKVLELKKAGACAVLIGHCTDCSNTVMGSAPKLSMDVHHATDHVLKTMGMPYIRSYDEDQL